MTATALQHPLDCPHCSNPAAGPIVRHPYRGGRRWALLARDDIESGQFPGHTYLWRLRIFQTPWFALYLHRIFEADTQSGRPEPFPHNHPAPFTMFILWGGYEELYWDAVSLRWAMERHTFNTALTEGIVQRWRPGTIHRMGTKDAHFIRRLFRVPSWTLLWVGLRDPDGWGFFTTDRGYVPWQEFTRT